MVIEYNDRKIEITDFKMEDGGFLIYEAYYLDTPDMPALSDREMDELAENCFDLIYEKMSKGSGY